MAKWPGFEHGIGIGGWLTNYKRFNVLPNEWRKPLTIGDLEHFRTYITEADVAYIASLGLDHIRLGFDQIVLQDENGCFREEIFALIDQFLDWCDRYGLHVVLNLHKAVGNYCDIDEPVSLLEDAGLQAGFIDFWLAFERRYVDRPSVAFELLNEVRDVPPELWNALAERTVAALRRENPTRPIIIGPTCWNSCHRLKELRLFDDPNVIYTFHMYEPHEFTHQRGVLCPAQCFYNREMPYPGDIAIYRDFHHTASNWDNAYPELEVMDATFIQNAMAPAAQFCAEHPDRILWCGEFGTIRHARLAYRENWMRDVIGFLKAHDIPWCSWNYLSTPYDGNRFSLVDDDSRTILSPTLAAILIGNG